MAISNQKPNYKIYHEYENLISLEKNLKRYLKKMITRIQEIKDLPNYTAQGSSAEKDYLDSLQQFLHSALSNLPVPPE